MYQLIVLLIPLTGADPVPLRHQDSFVTSVKCEEAFTASRDGLVAGLQELHRVTEGVHYRIEHECLFDGENNQRGS